jgi:hypothetical protein
MIAPTPPIQDLLSQAAEQGGSEDWSGLTVRTREGTVLGVVVGVFTEGLLAGRLRVEGDYRRRWTAWSGTGVSPSQDRPCCAGARTAWCSTRRWPTRGVPG